MKSKACLTWHALLAKYRFRCFNNGFRHRVRHALLWIPYMDMPYCKTCLTFEVIHALLLPVGHGVRHDVLLDHVLLPELWKSKT